MGHRYSIALATVVAGTLMCAAAAQTAPKGGTIEQPQYMSGAATGALSSQNLNTAEADGRPGWKFFNEGMQSYKQGDFAHAFYMLKLAAYWGYEPAAYNLGVMYFQGENVAKDRPLGAAWMFVAAQNGSSTYASARHMMVESLDGAERTQALADYDRLQPRYGAAAGRRAGAQWAYVKSQATGSRVGGAGSAEVRVGLPASSRSGAFHSPGTGPHGMTPTGGKTSAMQVLAGGTSEDASIAYRQFGESANPYSPVFIKNRSGRATVGPLQPVGAHGSKSERGAPAGAGHPAASTSSGQPHGN